MANWMIMQEVQDAIDQAETKEAARQRKAEEEQKAGAEQAAQIAD